MLLQINYNGLQREIVGSTSRQHQSPEHNQVGSLKFIMQNSVHYRLISSDIDHKYINLGSENQPFLCDDHRYRNSVLQSVKWS